MVYSLPSNVEEKWGGFIIEVQVKQTNLCIIHLTLMSDLQLVWERKETGYCQVTAEVNLNQQLWYLQGILEGPATMDSSSFLLSIQIDYL